MDYTLKISDLFVGGLGSPIPVIKKRINLDSGMETLLYAKDYWTEKNSGYKTKVLEVTPAELNITLPITFLQFILELGKRNLGPLSREEFFYSALFARMEDDASILFFTNRFPFYERDQNKKVISKGLSIPCLSVRRDYDDTLLKSLSEKKIASSEKIYMQIPWLVKPLDGH